MTADAELVAAGERRREAWARCEVARLVAEAGQFDADADVLEARFADSIIVWVDALAAESAIMLADLERRFAS